MSADQEPEAKGGLLRALSRSSAKLASGITGLFTKKKLNQYRLDELEELLITCDLGVATASKVTQQMAQKRFDEDITPDEIRGFLAEEIALIVDPVARPLTPDPAHKPHVVLVGGVNGTGKTTTIGKLAKQWRDQGKSVMLAAGDTFRAAAIEQIQVWGERTGSPVVAGKHTGPGW